MSCKRLAADNAPLLQTGSSNGTIDQPVPANIFSVAGVVKLATGYTTALAVIVGMLAALPPAAAAEDPADFIRTLGSQGFAVLASNESPAQKGAYFYHMLRQDFDLSAMSRAILGPYWGVASKAQRQQFGSLLPEYIVRFDGDRFAPSGGQGFTVTGSRSDAGDTIVTSQLIRPPGPPIEVDWRLGMSDGRYKISDYSIDGVSLDVIHRSEVAEIMQRNGGSVDNLLATMREKMANVTRTPPG
jgi:phospholipid transport system substrate-binding protein